MMGSHGDGAGAGPGCDLERATEAAVHMETKFGMGQRLTRTGRGTIWTSSETSPASGLMEAVDEILAEELTRAKSMLLEEMKLFTVLAGRLKQLGSFPQNASMNLATPAAKPDLVEGREAALSNEEFPVTVSAYILFQPEKGSRHEGVDHQ
jgi:hypothetical protein